MHLIVITYAFDSESMLFSHQSKLVNSLAAYFSKVTVLTRGQVRGFQPKNITVRAFMPNGRYSQLTFLLWLNYQLLTLVFRRSDVVVFSHMHESASAAVGPLLKVLNKKHVLWYAHKAAPLRLRLAAILVNDIITSTKGSFTLKTSKLQVVGQAVDPSQFNESTLRSKYKFKSWCHVGRLDESKNLRLIIDNFIGFLKSHPNSQLTFYGEVSSNYESTYLNSVREDYAQFIDSGKIIFAGKVQNSELASCLSKHDLFVHAFAGSLDKTLIEATLSLLPVVTINKEYLSEFGAWNTTKPVALHDEIEYLQKLSSENIEKILMARKKHALQFHSLDSWLPKVVSILKSGLT